MYELWFQICRSKSTVILKIELLSHVMLNVLICCNKSYEDRLHLYNWSIGPVNRLNHHCTETVQMCLLFVLTFTILIFDWELNSSKFCWSNSPYKVLLYNVSGIFCIMVVWYIMYFDIYLTKFKMLVTCMFGCHDRYRLTPVERNTR